MKTIEILHCNWRQVGSTIDRDGAGEDYDRYQVGKSGVILIEEFAVVSPYNYLIHFEDGKHIRAFNPNYIEYSKLS